MSGESQLVTVSSPIETLSTLRRLPLFNGLPDDQLALIAGGATRLHFDSGALIFSEGDLCNELLIVEEGEARLVKSAHSIISLKSQPKQSLCAVCV